MLGPDGNLYVSSHKNGAAFRFDGLTGGFIDSFVPSGSGGRAAPAGLPFTEFAATVPDPSWLA